MRLGITGTRKGWTTMQGIAFKELLAMYEIIEFHHGDCEGVDAQAAKTVIKTLGSEIVHCHPPTNAIHRAYIGGSTVYRAKDYRARNMDIVTACDLLVVIPRTDKEIMRSGTWMTYRMAKRSTKPVVIIERNGTLKWEGVL